MHLLRLWFGRFMVCFLAHTAIAQIADSASQPPANSPTRLFGESRTLLEKGDLDAAEARQATGNRMPAQTAQWHLENATNLLRLAFSAKEKGDAENAKKAAWRALAQTNRAARLAADNDPALLSRIATLRATLSEHFLGTTTSADSQRRVAEDQEREAKKAPEKRRKKPDSPEKDKKGKPRDKPLKPTSSPEEAESK